MNKKNEKAEQQGNTITEDTLLKIKEVIIKSTSSMNEIYVAVFTEFKKIQAENEGLKAENKAQDETIKKMKIELKKKK